MTPAQSRSQPTTIYIHPSAPAKPAWGATCNGCGVCCLLEPCPLGVLLTGRRQGACDAVMWSDTQHRYQCGMVLQPRTVLQKRYPRLPRWALSASHTVLTRWARRWISAGSGCDASVEVEKTTEINGS